MRLRRALHTGVAAACIAGLAAPAGIAAPAAPAASAQRAGPVVRVAQARDFSHIELQGAPNAAIRRVGQDVIVRLPRASDPDISRLRVDPPPWVKTAIARRAGAYLELVVTLADGADAKTGSADGATFINAFAKPAAAAAATPPAAAAASAPSPEPARPNPVPVGGVVRMDARMVGGQVQLTFPWAQPNGAAVFRRGDAIWVVFDAPANLDISRAPRGLRQFTGMKAYKGADYSAVRIETPTSTPVYAFNQGAVWTIGLGPGLQSDPALIKVARGDAGGPAALTAAVAGTTRIVRVADPAVGDTLTVATALGPAKGLPSRREFVQMALLPSAQGLAVESFTEDVAVNHDGDLVSIGRPAGLALSAQAAGAGRARAEVGAPQPAGSPGLIDYENWPKTGSGGFLSRYNALLDAASEEGAKGKESAVSARMALARFLVGTELSFEAIGVLTAATRDHPELLNNAEFRGLRGIARVMARRYTEASADFSAPILADDPSSALWRAYIAAQNAQWGEARTQFAAGAEAYNQFSPMWQARFARSDAEAALALGDIGGASARIQMALGVGADPLEELATRLIQARILEAQGETGRALRIYNAVANAPVEYLQAPALLRATQIRYQEGDMPPSQAAAVFDGLRYRWRGDATELETIRALGQLYLGQGRYREALEALRSAGMRMPDLPEAVALQTDLATAFRSLFLDGLADGLEPIQALAMFYDFKDLTPLGADGDMMVRKLVRRLVDVDLLPQAADLLRYQVDNRLDGVPRAQVATDLALIYLMNRQPEQALIAINGSRTTVLPTTLNSERRVIEARALMGLGQLDHALEVLDRDLSPEARDVRAEVTWKQKDWAAAGVQFEASLGDRWKAAGPLTAEEEGKLLRAGVAFSLAGDGVALARLQTRYQGFFGQARNPEALRVALTGVPDGRMSVADFSRATADTEAFGGWVSRMKQRFRERPAPLGAPTPKQAAAPPAKPPGPPAKQAQAAAPASKG